MTELEDVISIPEISEKIIERLTDKKLLELHSDNFWQAFNFIRPSFWRKRAYHNYPNSELLYKLLLDFKIASFNDYCTFIKAYQKVRSFKSNLILETDQMIAYDPHQHTINSSHFISLYDKEFNIRDAIFPAESVFSLTIFPTNNPDKLLVTTTNPGDEDDSTIVEIFFLSIDKAGQKLKLKSVFKERFDLTVFTAYYAQDEKIMCFSHRFDSNDWDVSIIDSSTSTATVIEHSVFQNLKPLGSDLLNDGYHSGTQIMKRCRSAAFCVMNTSTIRFRKFHIPMDPYFDLFVHDGFIQALPHTTDRRKRTFGRFFKLVETEGDFEVVEIPIADSLDSFYPDDISRVGFSINGTSNEDSIYLTLRTWPQRSAADNSVKFRLLHYQFTPKYE
ncbi:Oidioi.mRNA.OKI2018_I69.chr1.g2294.t1.cds [Oikopleura dioica]|uniref:Oidioi.mRNA.OKI2018_I69.chr1.g2294.t1.cds n=1 Tax=Oikopleura dioica TaxID=34765 RepID=A0ABN7SW18_OIKDI|nr:Oidioi.mRNA.OKI2018_I69.chr1.g2294.t1.cds [Oikopleura dioica]